MKIFTLWILILSALSTGAPPSTKSFTALDVGTYVHNLSGKLSTPSGFKEKVGTVSGFIRIRRDFHLGKNYYLEPSLGATLPWKSGLDGSIKIFTFQTGVVLVVPLLSFLKARIGPGLLSQIYLSKQEEVVLRNGPSSSSFYTSDRSLITHLFTVNSGLFARLSNRWMASIDVYWMDIAKRNKRSFNAAATLGISL